MNLFQVAALLLIFAALFLIGWRLLSRRISIPCPTWLIWTLEHHLMESVAGSEAIIQRLGVSRGMRVLDAGCGPGRITIPLAEAVGPDGEVIALDIQTEMLAKLQERSQAAGMKNISIIHTGLGEDTLDLGPFDRALMVTVLGEIPNRLKALQQIYEWLKPGGILAITEVLPDPHFQRASSVRALADRAGFEVEMAYQSVRAYTMHLIKPAP